MEQIRGVTKAVERNVKEVGGAARERAWGYIVAALGLVAGLAWNEAIKGMIDQFFPMQGDSVWAKFVYAIVITLIVVVVMVKFESLFKKNDDR